jgi:flavin-dependent dehydrogenase
MPRVVHAGARVTAELRADICILGGGPAGAVAAWKLAKLGYDVIVVERGARAPPRVGEALSPGIWTLLEQLDLTDVISGAGFRPTAESLVFWSDDVREMEHPDPPGLMVDRARFDALLLGHARKAGARVFEPAMAERPERAEGKVGGWLVRVRGRDAGTANGARFAIDARFMIDARGRAAGFGGAKVRDGASTVALNGVWSAPANFGAATRVEAAPAEWLWAAMRPDGSVSAMVFTDTERYREERANGVSREALYRRLLERSALLGATPAGRLVCGVTVHDATSLHALDAVGDDALKVGEAAFTLDPLSSTGVQRAMQSGWQGAIVAHTLLSKPSQAAVAREFYEQAQAAVVTRHREWAAQTYGESRVAARGDSFWNRRSAARTPATPRGFPRRSGARGWRGAAAAHRGSTAPAAAVSGDTVLRLSRAAIMVPTPCVVGDFIETRTALSHPALERPVAYLGDVEISPLLEALPALLTLSELRQRWSRLLARDTVSTLSDWLMRQDILVPKSQR